MGTKLMEITPQYRSFVDDQVLTSGQLNEFIAYFEDQDRLTRVCLVGVGVACGFKVSVNNQNSLVTVTQGCGVTTDGDLLKLQKSIKNSSDTSIVLESIKYSHFIDFEDDKAKYKHFRNGNATIDLWELIPQEKVDLEAGHLPINSQLLNEKVVVLYLESFPKEADICTTTNCDNQGQLNIQNLRVLLIDREDVENIVNAKDAIFTKHNVYEAFTNLPQTAVPKVILNDGNATSYTKLAAAYKAAVTSSKNGLHSAFQQLFQGFSDVLDIKDGTSNTMLNQINNLDDFNTNEKVQYRYDLVRDLSDTYNELAEILLKLKTECCPNIEAFPKHLLLGTLSSEEVYPELRHDFYHSPTNNEYAKYLKMAKGLVQRVVLVLDNFNLSDERQIAVTPSKTCGNLGEKAIPVYYEVDAEMLTAWDFNKTENYKQRFNVSFHKENLAPNSWVQNPLQFELDCNDFYRIEGHFGHPAQDSRNAINNLKNDYALDFDCLLFDLQKDAQAFTSFLRENPSIAHKAGVPKGGTFVLVSERENVVADFCISTKISTASDGCCSLMECTYPWISSLKYMNNLSRSLKGTQSRNKPMPQNYVLQVIEYRINGEPLINRTTTISIPLKEIFLRRIHAVTEALNKKFEKGVVFDFNESQKRLVITRAKEDTFTIRLREISQANNNAIYTYSNNGMFRNNRVFRPDAMRCRDLRSYREAFYQKLHAQIAPVNKDDDYGTYDEKWAKWSKLTERLVTNPIIIEAGLTRMVTSSAQLPQEIRTIIGNLKRDLNQAAGTGVNLQFRLDGDWVNGTWVNKFMLDHHRRNKKNTHDDIVLFVNLRKYLHNETGVTKLSIYITNFEYSSVLDAAMAKYKTVADFYFGTPTGENAIRI